jgi:Na+-driven multidrug efflux pump
MLCIAFGVLGTFINYFGGSLLFSLIIPHDPQGIAAGASYLRIDALAQIFIMMEVCFQGFFYGMHKPLPPSIISISCNFLRIPFAYWLVNLTGDINMLWWTICLSCVLKGTIASGYYLLHSRAKIYPEEPLGEEPV